MDGKSQQHGDRDAVAQPYIKAIFPKIWNNIHYNVSIVVDAAAGLCRRSPALLIEFNTRLRTSQPKKNEYPKVISMSGNKILGGSPGASGMDTDEVWCKVFHQSTENLMMGRLMEPTIATRPAIRAARRLSGVPAQTAIYPINKNNNINVEVILPSHCQNVPQLVLPHRLPLSRPSAVKAAPGRAQARANSSAKVCRQIYPNRLATAIAA